jgi:hypothetical protein
MSWWFGWWLFRNTYIPEVVYYEDEKTAFRTGGEYRSQAECLEAAVYLANRIADGEPSRIREYWCRKIDFRGNFVERVQ